jgi:hypothetical protein
MFTRESVLVLARELVWNQMFTQSDSKAVEAINSV